MLRKWNQWKHTIQTFNISNKSSKNHPNLSSNQSTGPIEVLDHLTPALVKQLHRTTEEIALHQLREA